MLTDEQVRFYKDRAVGVQNTMIVKLAVSVGRKSSMWAGGCNAIAIAEARLVGNQTGLTEELRTKDALSRKIQALTRNNAGSTRKT